MEEQRSFKPRVAGSNPVAGTKIEFKIVKHGSTTQMVYSQRIAIELPDGSAVWELAARRKEANSL